jgi:hypothetical protein
MPLLHRIPSETTHASDSEPEREAHRRAHEKFHSSPAESSSPPPRHMPLSTISNTVVKAEPRAQRTLDNRLSAIERDLAEIKDRLEALRPRSASYF